MSVFGLSTPTILLCAIAAAAVLVYLPFLVVGYARVTVGYDQEMRAAPRAGFDKLPGFGQRATWAHQNSWESFMLFSVAALMAYVTGQTSDSVTWAAVAYLPIRLIYSAAYVFNVPIVRSLMFALGSACIFTLIAASITSTIQG